MTKFIPMRGIRAAETRQQMIDAQIRIDGWLVGLYFTCLIPRLIVLVGEFAGCVIESFAKLTHEWSHGHARAPETLFSVAYKHEQSAHGSEDIF